MIIIVITMYQLSLNLFLWCHALFGNRFGGDYFSYSRMSWIKTNFLWMMYRCGWATKRNQERVLAVTITRDGFEEILANALTGTNTIPVQTINMLYLGADEKARGKGPSNVRLQWDPDHHPNGSPQNRRAIQLGLRNEVSHYVK